MKEDARNELHEKILKKYELYKLQGSRVNRFLKDPIRTAIFFIKQAIAYIHPYKIKYETLWGDSMEFYLPEGSMIYYYGFWEANLVNFLLKFIKEGDTFLDIGAHVGYYSVLSSRLVGETGKVYAFEPTPRTFTSLSKNLKYHTNAKVFNNAILDKETAIDFVDYGPKYSAFNSFKKREDPKIHFLNDGEHISVETIILDTFCSKNNIIPTFVKIDAEGAEHLILSAMSKILTEIKPVVSIEVSHTPDFRENSIRSIQLLKDYGYKGYIADTNGNLKSQRAEAEYSYENIIFIHETAQEKILNLISE